MPSWWSDSASGETRSETGSGGGGELQYLYVARDHRRRGAASALFRELARWFDDRGARRICVDVTPENAAARSFYRRHGAIELNRGWMVWEDIRRHGRAGSGR